MGSNKSADITSDTVPNRHNTNDDAVRIIANHSQTENNISWKNSVRQIIASVVIHLLNIQVGICLCFTAVFLPQVKSDWIISEAEATWIASLVPITLPIGSAAAGPLMDRLGRKRMSQLVTLPFCMAWVIQANANAVWHVYVARVIVGVACGLTTVTLVYVAEVTHPRMRSMMLSLVSVFVSLGVLLTCLLQYYRMGWRDMSYVFLLGSLIALVGMSCLPESPQWNFVFRNDTTKAAKSLHWLYTDRHLFNQQYSYLVNNPSLVNGATASTPLMATRMRTRHVYSHPSVYRPLLILLLVFTAQQLSGAYAIVFYAGDLFKEMGDNSTGQTNLLLFGAIRFAGAVASASCSRHVGRRPILLISTGGMTVTILIAGWYLVQPANGQMTSVVPVYSVLAYVLCSAFGLLSVPWTLIGELLPVRVRGQLGGALVAYAYILMFALVKAFPWVLDAVALQHVFYTIGAVNLCGACVIYGCLPETLGRSATEIEKYFAGENDDAAEEEE